MYIHYGLYVLRSPIQGLIKLALAHNAWSRGRLYRITRKDSSLARQSKFLIKWSLHFILLREASTRKLSMSSSQVFGASSPDDIHFHPRTNPSVLAPDDTHRRSRSNQSVSLVPMQSFKSSPWKRRPNPIVTTLPPILWRVAATLPRADYARLLEKLAH